MDGKDLKQFTRQFFFFVLDLVKYNKMCIRDRSIERTANSNKRKPSAHYKPSSLNCIRNMFYQIVEQEPDKMCIRDRPHSLCL